jgi:nicotinic acid phosphoribosyltransferase
MAAPGKMLVDFGMRRAHDDEAEAFEHFAQSQPDNVVLLIDTYDTERGAEKVVALAPRLNEQGIAIKGVRLDSGDLADHAFRVRKLQLCDEYKVSLSPALRNLVADGGYAYRIRPE